VKPKPFILPQPFAEKIDKEQANVGADFLFAIFTFIYKKLCNFNGRMDLMRKSFLFLLVLLLLIGKQESVGQNLVPNGDFEQYIHCPQNWTQLDSCLLWINPSIVSTGGSPDYFNQCDVNNIVGVPYNSGGFQMARSGKAYSGFCIYHNSGLSDFREYIEVPLKSPLEANFCYYISMYVNLCNNCPQSGNDIGAYFSDILITGVSNYFPLPFTPQYNNSTTVLSDTLNWILVEGNILANGGEKFLIIGNFKNDANTNITTVNPTGSLEGAYLYIDDVSVYKCNTPVYAANAGSDKKICPGDSVQLEMQFFTEYQYKWYTSDGVLLDTTNTITVSPATTTQYVLWVKDFKYDQSYDTVMIIIDENCISLEIPNVFTPNGDGSNDYFFVKSDNLATLNMVVYNRWGKKVFETNELSPGWDGKLNGQQCAEGVYFYVADVLFKNGQTASKNGTVTLVR
jgi:gliding motility-associated-like protein